MSRVSDALEAFQNHSNASIEDTIAALEQLTVSGPAPSSSQRKRATKDAVSVARTCLKTAHSRLKQFGSGNCNANSNKMVADLVKVCCSCVDLLARNKETSTKNEQDAVRIFETATYTTLRLFITASKAFNEALKLAILLQSHFDEAYTLCHGEIKQKGRRTKSRSPATTDVVNMAIGTTVALVLCWAEGAAAFKDSNQVRSTLQAVQSLTPQWLSRLSCSPDQTAKHQQTLFKSLYRGALRLIENKQLDVLGETCNVMVTMFRQAQRYLACNGNAMLLTAAYKLSSHIVDVEQRMTLLSSIVFDGCETLKTIDQSITTDTLSTILSSANSLRKLVALHIDSFDEVLWFAGTDEELAIRTASALEVASTMVATRLQNQNQTEVKVDATTLLQSHIHMAVLGLGYASRLRKMVLEKRARHGRSRGRRRSVDAGYDLCGKVATLLGWPWPVYTMDIMETTSQTTTAQIVRLECICSDDQLSWLSSYLHDVFTTYSSTTPVDAISSSLAFASFMLALERWSRKEKTHGSFGLEEVMKRMHSLFSISTFQKHVHTQALQLVLWRFCGHHTWYDVSSQPNGKGLVNVVLASLMRAAMQANHDLLVSAVGQCAIESSKHESTLGVGPLLVWAYLSVVKDHTKDVDHSKLKAILCDELVANLDTAELKLIHALCGTTVFNTEVANLVNNQDLNRATRMTRGSELETDLRAAQEALALGLMATSLESDADLSLRAAGAIQKVLSRHQSKSSNHSSAHTPSAPLTWTLDLLQSVATQVALMCGVRGMLHEEETILRTCLPTPSAQCIGNTLVQCVFPSAPNPEEYSLLRNDTCMTSESLLSAALQHAEGTAGSPNMVEALHLAMQAYKESQSTTKHTTTVTLSTLTDLGGTWHTITTRCRIVMTLGRMYEDTGMVEEAVSAFKEGSRLARSIHAPLLEAVFVSELAVVQSKCCPGLVEETACSALSLLPSDSHETDSTLAVVVWYINAQCRLARARIHKAPQTTEVTRFSGHLPHAARPYVKATEEASLALLLSCSVSGLLQKDEKTAAKINASKSIKFSRTFPRSASAELQLELSILLSTSAREYSCSGDTTPPATVVYSPICDPSMAGTLEQWVALEVCSTTPHLYGRAATELVLPCARAGYGYIAAALLHLSLAPTLQFQHRLVLKTREKKKEEGNAEEDCCSSPLMVQWNNIVSEIASSHSHSDELEKKQAMLDRLEDLARRMVHGWVSTAADRSACHSETTFAVFVAAAVCPDGSGILLCRSTWPTTLDAPPLLLHLPFGKFTVDHALAELDALMEESTYSMKSMPTSTRQEQREWWKCRLRLDDGMERLMARVQRRWFGPWYALLTMEIEGFTSNADDFYLDLVHRILGKREISSWQADHANVTNSIRGYLLRCLCTVARWLVKENEGTNSKERKRQADAHLRQVAFTTVDFVSRSFGQPVPKSDSSDSTIDEVVEAFLRFGCKPSGASGGVEEGTSWPVVLVPDSRLQRLPLELMPGLQGQSMYRIPSLPCVSEAKGTRARAMGMEMGTGLGRESGNVPWPSVTSAYYALNPSGDLVETQQAFEDWFRQLPGWQGKSGIAPSAEELALALRREDLFVYCGHGGGEQYLPPSKLRSLPRCAASLLMGCSSGRLRMSPFTPLTAGQEEGGMVSSPKVTDRNAGESHCVQRSYYEPTGTVLSYLLAGCPVAVATLWDVTDKDIDRFAERLLKGWLTEGGGGDVGLAVALARSACKLAHFIGGSIVCYGLPTQINGYVT